MLNQRIKSNAGGFPRQGSRKEPLRLTALYYLKEALLQERYENCAEIIAQAQEFGATASDINGLLEDPRRNPG